MLFDRLMRRRQVDRRFGRWRNGVVTLGRYELLQPLGVGGMAQVFKARAVGPGGFRRDVVVKRILPEHGRDAEFIRMFVDEAKLLGLLHHPNVVQVYDFGEQDGVLFLALEYVDGPSLSRVLRTLRGANKRMPPAIAAFIAREICRALACVHELHDEEGRPLGAVHRDVTPSNVILTPAGEVKLLDFGVVKAEGRVTRTETGVVKGNVTYMAPEQARGLEVDSRADLYSVALVLYMFATGRPLYVAETTYGLLMKAGNGPGVEDRSAIRDLPPPLAAVIDRATATRIEDRYPTAREMAADLEIAGRNGAGATAALVIELFGHELKEESHRMATFSLHDSAHGAIGVSSA